MANKTDKRKKIIKAALTLLTKHGFHAAPMSMIAEKAGVGTGTIYTYFKSKDVLINAIFSDIEEDIVKYLGKSLLESLAVKEKFLRLWTMLLNYLVTHPINFRYLEQFHNSPYGISLRRDRISGKDDEPSILCDILKEGIGKDEIKNLPEPMLVALAFGPTIMIARDKVLGFITLDESMINRCAESCWDSICNDKAKPANKIGVVRP